MRGTEVSSTIQQPAEQAEPQRATHPITGHFVALSKFVIANEMTAQVKEAFVKRPHLVDDVPGFVRLDVISPLEMPDEIWLITYWTDEASFHEWHKSHTYRHSHAGIPKGLKLVPKSAQVLYFEHISS